MSQELFYNERIINEREKYDTYEEKLVQCFFLVIKINRLNIYNIQYVSLKYAVAYFSNSLWKTVTKYAMFLYNKIIYAN